MIGLAVSEAPDARRELAGAASSERDKEL